MLYSHNGSYPRPLPFRIKLSDGRTRTDPSSFTTEEIADAGYIAVANPPEISSTQVLEWFPSTLEWNVRNKTQEELNAESASSKESSRNQINEYRDELIAGGFWFNNVKYDSRPEDQKRISGAALLAFMAITEGAQVGDLFWHGGTTEFSWISRDNIQVAMDAFTVIDFAKKAAEHERAHIFAARELKDMADIPENFRDETFWPVRN